MVVLGLVQAVLLAQIALHCGDLFVLLCVVFARFFLEFAVSSKCGLLIVRLKSLVISIYLI